MTERDPVIELSPFSSEGATPTAWTRGLEELHAAEVYWLSTVRPDGRLHVTPLLAVWVEGALYFCTGSTERKAKNLAQNPNCVLTTGRSALEGPDVVVEGEARPVSAVAERTDVADAYERKYGRHFGPGGTWAGLGDAIRSGDACLFRVTPTVVFGFGKGERYSQTRWLFR